MIAQPTVFVIDDDDAVRDALSLQLQAAGLNVETFASSNGFLAKLDPQAAGCLVLDVRMPQMTGPELQAELSCRHINLPIIFLTGYGDIPLAVKAIQSGAVDFLTKPVNGQQLIDRVHAALALNAEQRQHDATYQAMYERLQSLTEREREVLALAIEGHPSKEIAKLCGISFRTVEHHRSNILLKTRATNLLELARGFKPRR
jgi:FixJ family two-component response regulator